MRKLPSNTIHDFGTRYSENKAEYMRAYMKIYNTTKIECCGMEICRGAMPKHLKTKRHLRNTDKKE